MMYPKFDYPIQEPFLGTERTNILLNSYSAPDKPPTLVNIYERFGPTHPGEYDQSVSQYYLHYPVQSFQMLSYIIRGYLFPFQYQKNLSHFTRKLRMVRELYSNIANYQGYHPWNFQTVPHLLLQGYFCTVVRT